MERTAAGSTHTSRRGSDFHRPTYGPWGRERLRFALVCLALLAMSPFMGTVPNAVACGAAPGGFRANDEIAAWVSTGPQSLPHPLSTWTDLDTCAGAELRTSDLTFGPWGCRYGAPLPYSYTCHGIFARNGEVCDVRWWDMAVDGSPWELNDKIYYIECREPRLLGASTLP